MVALRFAGTAKVFLSEVRQEISSLRAFGDVDAVFEGQELVGDKIIVGPGIDSSQDRLALVAPAVEHELTR